MARTIAYHIIYEVVHRHIGCIDEEARDRKTEIDEERDEENVFKYISDIEAIDLKDGRKGREEEDEDEEEIEEVADKLPKLVDSREVQDAGRTGNIRRIHNPRKGARRRRGNEEYENIAQLQQ